MDRKCVSTDKAPAAVGPYSQAVRFGGSDHGLIYTAGQLGIVPGTKAFAGTDIEAQTRQALRHSNRRARTGWRLTNPTSCRPKSRPWDGE